MPQIYLDMDGLVADYNAGLEDTAKELGVSIDDGKAIWNKINSNPVEWWSNLKPIPEGMKIFNAMDVAATVPISCKFCEKPPSPSTKITVFSWLAMAAPIAPASPYPILAKPLLVIMVWPSF